MQIANMIETINGDKIWYSNYLLHRINGPAIELINGHKEWWVNGELHREDGPAMEYASGSKAWYINGIRLNDLKNIFLKCLK